MADQSYTVTGTAIDPATGRASEFTGSFTFRQQAPVPPDPPAPVSTLIIDGSDKGLHTVGTSGNYRLFANEYNSAAAFSIGSDGLADFEILASAISTGSTRVGAYPALFTGKHWGRGTADGVSGMPVQLSAIRGGGKMTSKLDADFSRVAPGDRWNCSYDLFLCQTAAGSNSAEIMIWLNRAGCQPAGTKVASAAIGGTSYDVWRGGYTTSYVCNSPRTSTDLDLGLILNDGIARGYFPETWYLIVVEAGFELWSGGKGLKINHFEVNGSQ